MSPVRWESPLALRDITKCTCNFQTGSYDKIQPNQFSSNIPSPVAWREVQQTRLRLVQWILALRHYWNGKEIRYSKRSWKACVMSFAMPSHDSAAWAGPCLSLCSALGVRWSDARFSFTLTTRPSLELGLLMQTLPTSPPLSPPRLPLHHQAITTSVGLHSPLWFGMAAVPQGMNISPRTSPAGQDQNTGRSSHAPLGMGWEAADGFKGFSNRHQFGKHIFVVICKNTSLLSSVKITFCCLM